MRTSIVVALVAVGFSISSFAQSDTSSEPKKNKIVYYNNFLAGGLFGEQGQGSGLTVSMTHGVRLNRFALGAGVGFDSYIDWKTVPIFGSVNFDFAKIRHNAFFVQFNAGYSNADRVVKEEFLFLTREYGGAMYNSLIGYRIAAQKFRLYIAAGHKYQRTHFSYNAELWSSYYPAPTLKVEENIHRVVVQIGFGWR
jgi:hypothetical protein